MNIEQGKRIVILLCICIAVVGNVCAQQKSLPSDNGQVISRALEPTIGQIVRVKTAGGGEFQGKLLSANPERVELQSGEGLILQITTAEILEFIIIDSDAEAGAYYQDAASNKLIVIPVGFGMDPGEFHIADQELVLVTSSYGFSERFSIWGGLSIPGAVVNARWSFEPSANFGLSAGTFAGALFIDGGVVLIPYTIASFGTADENFTIAIGAPYFNESLFEYDNFYFGGVVVLGGKKVLSQTASLITENWILVLSEYWQGSVLRPQIIMAPSIAFRIAGSRFSWDLGVTLPLWISSYYDYLTGSYGGYSFQSLEFPIPILGFTYRIQ